MALQGKVVLITGASLGIGKAIAQAVAKEGANLILFSRSEDKLKAVADDLKSLSSDSKIIYRAVDVGNHEAVDAAVASSVKELGDIDVLINNAGLALGAPSIFPELKVKDILTMNSTNINGLMLTTYSVLNHSMLPRQKRDAQSTATILNVTSTTALEVPPFPGEAVYHANKACQEGFTNALRNELTGTNIKVLALRPGVVATHFHTQRVGFDKNSYEEFVKGFQPLVADDVAKAAVYVLSQPTNISIKALDIVATAQRSLPSIDKTWNERNGLKDNQYEEAHEE